MNSRRLARRAEGRMPECASYNSGYQYGEYDDETHRHEDDVVDPLKIRYLQLIADLQLVRN